MKFKLTKNQIVYKSFESKLEKDDFGEYMLIPIELLNDVEIGSVIVSDDNEALIVIDIEPSSDIDDKFTVWIS